MGVFPFQGKTHMVEPGIELGTSWSRVRFPNHEAGQYCFTVHFNIILWTTLVSS